MARSMSTHTQRQRTVHTIHVRCLAVVWCDVYACRHLTALKSSYARSAEGKMSAISTNRQSNILNEVGGISMPGHMTIDQLYVAVNEIFLRTFPITGTS